MADLVMRTTPEMAAIVPEYWSARYYDVLLATLPFSSVISKDWEGEIATLGDTVNISSYPEFSLATELAEDAKNDSDAISIGSQQLIINKMIVKDFVVTKKATIQSLPHMDKLRELAIYAILKKIENLIIAAIVPNAAAPDHSIAYDLGTTLALADILEAKELLDAQNVDFQDRHMVVGSAQLNDIFNITGFTSSDFLVSGAPLQTGQLPAALLGFMPHFTTLVGNTSYFFHAGFMTMAAQMGIDVAVYDLGVEGKRQTRVNCTTLMGLKQLDGLRVVSIS